MKPLIVFVDDEPRLTDSYKRELEFDYEVKFISKVDDLVGLIKIGLQKVDLLILDVMMPLGNNKELQEANTNKGMCTGLVLYEMIRKNNNSLPIIIFTNVTIDEETQIIKTVINDDHAQFLQKDNCLPFELADKVKENLATK